MVKLSDLEKDDLHSVSVNTCWIISWVGEQGKFVRWMLNADSKYA